MAEGIPEERICLDPGIGFGKTVEHNLELLVRMDELVAIGRPVLVGASRKRFLGRVLGDREAVTGPVAAGVAINVLAYERGASLFRVHDVRENVEALAAARRWSESRRPCKSQPTPAGSSGAAGGAGPEGTVFVIRARRAPCRQRCQAAADPGSARREPPPARGARVSEIMIQIEGLELRGLSRCARGKKKKGQRFLFDIELVAHDAGVRSDKLQAQSTTRGS